MSSIQSRRNSPAAQVHNAPAESPNKPATNQEYVSKLVQRQHAGGKNADSAEEFQGHRPSRPNRKSLDKPRKGAADDLVEKRFAEVQAHVNGAGKNVPKISVWDASTQGEAAVKSRLSALTSDKPAIQYSEAPLELPAPHHLPLAKPQPSGALRVALLNPQGNFSKNYEGLNSHADMGGQITYVGELAKAMSEIGINAVVMARQFKDPRFPAVFNDAYSLLLQAAHAKAYVQRTPGGPSHAFRVKENLWSIADTWAREQAVLSAARGEVPHALTSHYADAGFTASRMSVYLGVPHVTFTGHSLGAQKFDGLLLNGKEDAAKAQGEGTFNMRARIAAERTSMESARKIIVSTDSERAEQYAHPLYLGAVDPSDENKFVTIPPGVNPAIFGPDAVGEHDAKTIAALEAAIVRDIPESRRHLPLIIVAGRLDPKKNQARVVQAYAESKALQDTANLLLLLKGGPNAFKKPGDAFVAGSAEMSVATQIADTLREHALDGKVAVPGLKNEQHEFAAICRHLGHKKEQGILTLVSLFEPFGLMPLEAALAGTPVVVTNQGGPTESLQDRHADGSVTEYGVLVDPYETKSIGDGLLRLTGDKATWKQFQQAGSDRVLAKYTWKRAAERYRDVIIEELSQE